MSEEVLQLSLRWTHLVAGVLWVGTTYALAWVLHPLGRLLDRDEPDAARRLSAWLLLGSAAAWLTGASLLGLLYYSGRWPYFLESGVRPSVNAWVSAFVGVLLAAPLAAVTARLGGRSAGWLSPLLLLAGALGLAWWLEQRGVSRRAMHVHAGAFVATGMLAWVSGQLAPSLAAADWERARRALRHSARVSIPLLLLMVSVDQPILTGHDPWPLSLGGVLALGYALGLLIERGLGDPGT